MKKFGLLWLSLLLASVFHAQSSIEISPEQAAEIIRTKAYDHIQPIEINLDSSGTKIIRTLFNDKANFPDRISLKEYISNPFLDERDKKSLSYTYKCLQDKKKRKEVYTLTDEDSLLVFRRQIRPTRHTEGQRGFWSFVKVDTTIAKNSFYNFFVFEMMKVKSYIPYLIANTWTYGTYGPIYLEKMRAIIYKPKFMVGIPKVNLLNKNGSQIYLPLILFSREFISYSSNMFLLEKVLRTSDYSEGENHSLMVYLDALSEYDISDFKLSSCDRVNQFKGNFCYRFSTKPGFDFIATMDKSYKIRYTLPDDASSLIPHIKRVFEARHDTNYKYLKVTLKSKRGRKYIFEIEAYPRYQYKIEKYKAIYNHGEFTFKLLNQND